MSEPQTHLLVSVVIVSYNSKPWLPRCLETLQAQTLYEQTEVIFVDNISQDRSDLLAQALMKGWPRGAIVQTGANLGFGGGANRGAALARGKYLFFLNPDVWLEKDCLQRLVEAGEQGGYDAVGPTILDYYDDSLHSIGASGFDIFGLPVNSRPSDPVSRLFSSGGCSFFIRRDLFQKIGQWDERFFMYGEELDIGWRIWIAGGIFGTAPAARVHHRHAAVNLQGNGSVSVLHTSDSKRFHANRNHLLTLLKSPQHFLLLLLVPAVALTLLEGLVGAAWLRRWSFFSNTSWRALASCWQMRSHWMEQRRRIKQFRRHGDFWMARFLSWRLSRWYQIRLVLKLGMPKVEQQ
jgi:hypothetical protein